MNNRFFAIYKIHFITTLKSKLKKKKIYTYERSYYDDRSYYRTIIEKSMHRRINQVSNHGDQNK